MSKIKLFDINPLMCNEWKYVFDDIKEVEIINDEFKNIKSDCIVTAGNVWGLMTGGIDLAVRDYFGIEIQDAIQELIFFYCKEPLKIGDVLVLPTYDKDKPYLAYAPTMYYPRAIMSKVVYKVMLAILERCYNMEGTLAIPGLGTGTGQVPFYEAAEEMFRAYIDYKDKQKKRVKKII